MNEILLDKSFLCYMNKEYETNYIDCRLYCMYYQAKRIPFTDAHEQVRCEYNINATNNNG